MDSEPASPTNIETESMCLFDRMNNMEQCTVVWLHRKANVRNSDHSKYIRAQLRDIIDYLQAFNDVIECEQYIREAKNESIFFVVSSEFAQVIIPNVHAYISMRAIYIYKDGDTNSEADCINENWQKVYPKVTVRLKSVNLTKEKVIDKTVSLNVH